MEATRAALARIDSNDENGDAIVVQPHMESNQPRITLDDDFDASEIPQTPGVYWLLCAHGDHFLIAATSDLRQEIEKIHSGIENASGGRPGQPRHARYCAV